MVIVEVENDRLLNTNLWWIDIAITLNFIPIIRNSK